MNSHERFEELSALAMSGTLTAKEERELDEHLQFCQECRREQEQYLLLTREGMPMLAEAYRSDRTAPEVECNDEDADCALVQGRISEAVMRRVASAPQPVSRGPKWIAANPIAGALAACLILAAGLGAYRFATLRGFRAPVTKQAGPMDRSAVKTIGAELQNARAINQTLESELNARNERIVLLLQERSRISSDIEKLQANLKEEVQRTSQITSSLKRAGDSNASLAEQLAAASAERDDVTARLQTLSAQFQTALAEVQNAKAEVKRITTERDRADLRIASLQTQREDLLAHSEEQEHRLDQAEEYLARDQDIRDLMGARQLYMADVFDVLGNSQTRNPYGRIFYTKERSLIFYAFDLDRQPGAQKASFQAWGRTESSQTPPVNLGILYQDNQQNRRWVLRFNDGRQLSRIDSIFVTIEPQGGSQKPTGKRFLYASLRREPNHP